MIEENIRRKKSKEISDTQQDDEGGHWKRGEREGFSKCWTEKERGREDKESGSVRVISRVIFTLFTVRVRVIFTLAALVGSHRGGARVGSHRGGGRLLTIALREKDVEKE